MDAGAAPALPRGKRLSLAPPALFNDHPRVYSLFDVNLAPPETPCSICVRVIRLIEGGAQGVPYVASAIAPYTEFHNISGGVGGYLASTTGEWVEGISRVIQEREARGATLANYVRDHRSLSVVAGQWQTSFQDILTGKGGQEIAGGWSAGRNDPCPCGSGKKAKRCCGGSSASGLLLMALGVGLLLWW